MSEKGVPDDILEQILFRLDDLEDLIRFMSVCKSWHSFISSPRFAKYHLLKHSKNSNTKRRKTRIIIREAHLRKHLLGSSNGLVCIQTLNAEIIVLNPLTRELKKLQNPHDYSNTLRTYIGGFGYGSSSDDYKIILGRRDCKKDNLMCFHVLSLKSNAWKVVGDRKYRFDHNLNGRPGILCNGSLHWFMLDQHSGPVILSFDLSTEEFKEIPIPDVTGDKYSTIVRYSLGLIEENLCIFRLYTCDRPIWVMKNYNGKQCWELIPRLPHLDNDVALQLKMPKLYNENRVKGSFFHQGEQCDMLKPAEYLNAPIYVQSLVSPQVNETRTKESTCITSC